MQKYIHLLRLHQPNGFMLLMLPCFWGIFAAFSSFKDIHNNLLTIILFAIGSVVMRSAGCVINDIFDKDLDKHVSRTSKRPLASGAISTIEAITIFCLLCLVGLAILLSLNKTAIMIGFISFFLFILYPLMKRITYWPQLFLGLTFNIGVIIGFVSINGNISLSIFFLYLAGIFWTLGYDTIYAHQDREDDLRIGIKSTAILFGDNSKLWISSFYLLMIICLLIFGQLSDFKYLYYTSLLLVGFHLLFQLFKLDICNSEVCLEIFKSNRYTGALIMFSLLLTLI